jgi:hypothetical protein
LPIVQLLAAIRALPETVSNLIAARPELIRGSLGDIDRFSDQKDLGSL